MNTPSGRLSGDVKLPPQPGRRGEGGGRTRGLVKQSLPGRPLVTIIVAIRNGATHLESVIASIRGQSYDNVEFLVIDGGSTDGTLEILRQNEGAIDYWVSEPDTGISDAFNKGVRLARGDWINFQGAGDGFVFPEAIARIVDAANGNTNAIVSGAVLRIDRSGHPIHTTRSPRVFRAWTLLFRMSLPHQGLFVPRSFFERYGLFDTTAVFAMDYEHLLRAHRSFPTVIISPEVVARWRDDGIGTGRTVEVLREYDRIKRQNGVAPGPVLWFLHRWNLIKNGIKTTLHAFGIRLDV